MRANTSKPKTIKPKRPLEVRFLLCASDYLFDGKLYPKDRKEYLVAVYREYLQDLKFKNESSLTDADLLSIIEENFPEYL